MADSAFWSYGLAVVGITGLLIAATRPKVGWWFNIAAQAAWVSYAIATRQWGFLASAMAYAIAYARLLRRAHQPKAIKAIECDDEMPSFLPDTEPLYCERPVGHRGWHRSGDTRWRTGG